MQPANKKDRYLIKSTKESYKDSATEKETITKDIEVEFTSMPANLNIDFNIAVINAKRKKY